MTNILGSSIMDVNKVHAALENQTTTGLNVITIRQKL
jgi:hypothetical protein